MNLKEIVPRARVHHDLDTERRWQFRLEGMMPRALLIGAENGTPYLVRVTGP